MDLLEELAELDGGGKEFLLREILSRALVPGEPVEAHEVVAAAALVALALPGGMVAVSPTLEGDFDPDDQENAEDEWTSAFLGDPDAALTELAIASLLSVTGEGGRWREVWVVSQDRDEALRRVTLVVAVLNSALRPS